MLQTGSVVKSIAGHDKNKFYVIVSMRQDYVTIADGRARKLAKPKIKNIKHIRATKTILDLEVVTTDKKLRLALLPFQGTMAVSEQEGGN